MRIDKQQIWSEIKRTAQQNDGIPLGKQRFSRETGIKQMDWEGKLWARWGDALREAGFAANQFTTAYDEEILIEKFVLLLRELGRFPVARELSMKARKDKDFPALEHSNVSVRNKNLQEEFSTTAIHIMATKML